MVLRGYLNKTIAKELNISAATVREYLWWIYQKAGVRSRSELISKALLPSLAAAPKENVRNLIEEAHPVVSNLTPREKEIYSMVLLGDPSKKIAFRLGIRVSSVHVHLQRIYKKAGVHSRGELILQNAANRSSVAQSLS